MYRDRKVSLVIPAYREAKLIAATLARVPAFIDKVYVVDDASPDDQNRVIKDCMRGDPRIELIEHKVNQGPGAAIITGYLRSAAEKCDITVVAGGDNQMPLEEAPRLLDPIIDQGYDYAKGNRFLEASITDTLAKMPRIRLVGNTIITALTKIASGYYKTMDVVEGFTAITRDAILKIDWDKAWKRYGYPMDFLIRLNAYGCRIKDVPRTAIYLEGERQSQIKGFSYAVKVAPMLLRGFFWRLSFRYLYRDFHPLVFFYYIGFVLLPIGFIYGAYMTVAKVFGHGEAVTASRAMLAALLIITGLQFFLFAMLFDMQATDD